MWARGWGLPHTLESKGSGVYKHPGTWTLRRKLGAVTDQNAPMHA